MPLFDRTDRTGSKLSAGPTLLLAADPGDALIDAARLYDPQLRAWHGRLVFGNGVLLFGPVTVTPKLIEQAGLPASAAVAWYADAALQAARERRPDERKRADGESLVLGLAARLDGSVHPWPPLRQARAGSPRCTASGRSPRTRWSGCSGPTRGRCQGRGRQGRHVRDQRQARMFYTAYWSPRLYTGRSRRPRSARCARARCITGTCTAPVPHGRRARARPQGRRGDAGPGRRVGRARARHVRLPDQHPRRPAPTLTAGGPHGRPGPPRPGRRPRPAPPGGRPRPAQPGGNVRRSS